MVLASLKSRVCANWDLARELQNKSTTKIVIYIKYLGIKSHFLKNFYFKFQFSTYGYTRWWHGIGSAILQTDRIIGDGDDDKNDQMDGREIGETRFYEDHQRERCQQRDWWSESLWVCFIWTIRILQYLQSRITQHRSHINNTQSPPGYIRWPCSETEDMR